MLTARRATSTATAIPVPMIGAITAIEMAITTVPMTSGLHGETGPMVRPDWPSGPAPGRGPPGGTAPGAPGAGVPGGPGLTAGQAPAGPPAIPGPPGGSWPGLAAAPPGGP